MRSGVIAQKVGMTRVFTETGEHIPVTVLKLGNCQVLGHRTTEKNGYVALQLGSGTRKTVYLPKAERGQFAVAKVEPKRKVTEFRVSEDALIPVGAEIQADHFVVGQFVDVTGTSVGKGFAGGMKRWNFGGLRATHGVSVSHRSIGSTGGRQDPGKTYGAEATAVFTDAFTKAGGQVVETIGVPLANPDFAPFLQRVARSEAGHALRVRSGRPGRDLRPAVHRTRARQVRHQADRTGTLSTTMTSPGSAMRLSAWSPPALFGRS